MIWDDITINFDKTNKLATLTHLISTWIEQNYLEMLLPGVVLEKVGKVSYRIQVGEGIRRRHADQIRNGCEELVVSVPVHDAVDNLPSETSAANGRTYTTNR